jgi:hypothetical protein
MNQRLRFICMGTLLACLLVVSSAAKADAILGTAVTGSMTSLNPTLLVTSPFISPALIGPGVEFFGTLHDTSFNQDFGISADFTAGGLILDITSLNPFSNLRTGTPIPFLDLTFSDSAFLTPFHLTSYTCASGSNACGFGIGSGIVSNTLVGSTLNLELNNIAAGQIYTFSDVAPVPEPASLALLGTGLLGLVGAVKKTSARMQKA